MTQLSKFERFIQNVIWQKKKIECSLGMHKWIYRFNDEGIADTRYCEECRKQEKYSQTDEEWLRIKNISYTEMD